MPRFARVELYNDGHVFSMNVPFYPDINLAAFKDAVSKSLGGIYLAEFDIIIAEGTCLLTERNIEVLRV
jgi:hypothetical protein